eukprot:763614-Hanusia_phi.AAC.1
MTPAMITSVVTNLPISELLAFSGRRGPTFRNATTGQQGRPADRRVYRDNSRTEPAESSRAVTFKAVLSQRRASSHPLR